ncbi:MAG: hypothetical protein FWF88_05915 [Peptococcaceae bacterium]|jgi:membrane-bound ClpP family serine protease|nr:hypothetical protein [Peptococcaceae bacterium]
MSFGFAFIIIILGIILICAELFLLTGTTVPGVAGVIVVLIGIWFYADGDLGLGALTFVCITLVVAVLCVIAYFTGHLGRAWKRFSLRTEQQNDEGYVAPDPEYKKYLNGRGEALTVLRPAGTAVIDGDRLDVVTEGGYIKQGDAVRVVSVEGVRIVVAKDEEEIV